MPLYGQVVMTNLPVSLRGATGWAAVLEIDAVDRVGVQFPQEFHMSESDVRELIELLEEAL